MRLAYFTNIYPRATDTFIRREVNGLRARDFEVITFSVRKVDTAHDVDEEVLREKSQTRYLLPISMLRVIQYFFIVLGSNPSGSIKAMVLAWKTSRPGIKGHLLQFAYFLEAIVLSVYLRQEKIEHIHNHFGDNTGNVTLMASLITKIPFSISIHGPHIFFDAKDWALDVKAVYARFIACIGYYCRSQLMLYTDSSNWEKFKIVRCGIDFDAYHFNARNKKEIKNLVYVGRLDVEKGVPVLISSMSILKEKGYDVKLTLLGDGPDRGYLEKIADNSGVSKQIDFRGFVSQEVVADTLAKSDVFVLPSFAEGIPVSLMEAMAIGVPVIATDVGGVTELVVDQETGQVVHASDEKGLAAAIARYVDDQAFYRKISEQAREKVMQEFDIDDQVDILAGLFRPIHS